jgi:hypothetical protein
MHQRPSEKRLRRLGSHAIAPSACFLVTFDNELVDGELDRAREWAGRSGASRSNAGHRSSSTGPRAEEESP